MADRNTREGEWQWRREHQPEMPHAFAMEGGDSDRFWIEQVVSDKDAANLELEVAPAPLHPLSPPPQDVLGQGDEPVEDQVVHGVGGGVIAAGVVEDQQVVHGVGGGVVVAGVVEDQVVHDVAGGVLAAGVGNQVVHGVGGEVVAAGVVVDQVVVVHGVGGGVVAAGVMEDQQVVHVLVEDQVVHGVVADQVVHGVDGEVVAAGVVEDQVVRGVGGEVLAASGVHGVAGVVVAGVEAPVLGMEVHASVEALVLDGEGMEVVPGAGGLGAIEGDQEEEVVPDVAGGAASDLNPMAKRRRLN